MVAYTKRKLPQNNNNNTGKSLPEILLSSEYRYMKATYEVVSVLIYSRCKTYIELHLVDTNGTVTKRRWVMQFLDQHYKK